MTRTKLISTKTETMPFRPHFNEIVSPQIEPATESSAVVIDQLLADLECLGDRPTSNAKVRVLLSSLRIPEHPAGHSDNIRPPKLGYPATLA